MLRPFVVSVPRLGVPAAFRVDWVECIGRVARIGLLLVLESEVWQPVVLLVEAFWRAATRAAGIEAIIVSGMAVIALVGNHEWVGLAMHERVFVDAGGFAALVHWMIVKLNGLFRVLSRATTEDECDHRNDECDFAADSEPCGWSKACWTVRELHIYAVHCPDE